MNGIDTKPAVNCQFILMNTHRSRWDYSVAWKVSSAETHWEQLYDWGRTNLPDKCQRKRAAFSLSHTHNLSTGMLRQKKCDELQASLGYSMRPLSNIKCQERIIHWTSHIAQDFSVTWWHLSDLSAHNDILIINMPSDIGIFTKF